MIVNLSLDKNRTVVELIPHALVIEQVLHCVAPRASSPGRPTLFRSISSSVAIALFVIPSAAINTIRDGSRSRTGTLRDRDHHSRRFLSPVNTIRDRHPHGPSPSPRVRWSDGSRAQR